MKTYTVHKNHHYCLHGQWMHANKTGLVISFVVHPESSYKLSPEEQGDINKIGGITFGLEKLEVNNHGVLTIAAVHENSIRIGMCGDEQDPSIVNIYLYYYNKGIRKYLLLKKSIYGIYSSFYIYMDRINNVLKVTDRMGPNSYTVQYDFTNVPRWGFYCYPYFGGPVVSPVDYKVDLAVITT